MNKKQIIDFALSMDPRREQWRIVKGPRRQKYLYHVENVAAWTLSGEKLPDVAAFQLCMSYAVFASNTMPL